MDAQTADAGKDRCALFLFVSYSLLTAIFVAMTRAPFQTPAPLIPAYYALISISVMATYSIGERFSLRDPLRFGGLSVFLALLLLAVPFAVSFAGLHAGFSVAAMLAVNAIALAPHLRQIPSKAMMLAIAFAAIFAGYCFLTVNSMGYAMVLSPEYALAGFLHPDTLYHSAIAAMFQQFRVVSTGLDGIPLTHYHVLTHIWLGVVAGGVGLNAIFGYFLGKQIVFIPLMYFSLIILTKSMSGHRISEFSNLASAVFPITIILLVGIVDRNSYFVSESYAAGLFLILLGIPFLLTMTESFEQPISTLPLSIGSLIGLTACAMKVSVGGVFLAGFLYLVFRSRKLTYPQYVLLALFGTVLAWLLRSYLLPTAQVGQSQLVPLDFARLYPSIAIINLLPILIAALICIWRWLGKANRAWQETLLVMLAASTAPAMLLKLDGGSAYYFINIGTWIAAAVIAAAMVRLLGDERNEVASLVAMAIALLVMGADMLQRDTITKFLAPFHELQELASRNSRPGAAVESAYDLKWTPLGRLVATIERYRQDGKAPIVMIEPDLWEQIPYPCYSAPFFVPAYTGLPLLLGLEPAAAKCDLGPHYSFPEYGVQAPPQDNLGDDKICALAKARGFFDVLHVETLDSARAVDCR